MKSRRSKLLVSIGALGLVLLLGLAVWATVGTIGLDGPAPGNAPATLNDARGDFELNIRPIRARIDEPIAIELAELGAGEDVVLKASTEDAQGTVFTSWAQFRANNDGTLDLTEVAPIEGSYHGVDSSGLLWSMSTDDRSLFYTSASWEVRRVRLQAETENGVVSTTIDRLYPWSEVRRESISDQGIVGELSLIPSVSAQPVIIKLGGWRDGSDPLTAALLADEGYAVLDLRYHDAQGTPGQLVEIPLETVSNAIDWIEQDSRLDATRVAVLGTSKGAELALLSASHEHRIKAVIAWSPASIVFSGIDFRRIDPGSSWTLNERPLAYAKPRFGAFELRNSIRLMLRRPVSLGPSYEAALEQAAPEASIPVEHIQGPILLISGTDDQVWPSSVMARQIETRLEQRGFEHQIVNLSFPGAGHGLSFGLWPKGGRRTDFLHRGGTSSLDHSAGQRAWRSTLDFLEKFLGKQDDANQV